MRARGLVRYGVCTQSHACRRRRFLVLRRGTSSGRPSRRRAVRHNTHRDPESGSAGPGTPRPGASGLALWGHRTRIPLRSRVADEYNRAPTRTAGLHGRYAPAVGLASCNTQVTARHPSTSAGQRHPARHHPRPPPTRTRLYSTDTLVVGLTGSTYYDSGMHITPDHDPSTQVKHESRAKPRATAARATTLRLV